jgi:ketosteroid isomerase-like protein
VLVRARHTEIVRRAFDLFEAGDLDALTALYHPRIELRLAGVLSPPLDILAGVDQARGWLQRTVDEGMNVHVDDLELDVVGNRVIVRGRLAPPGDIAMHWYFDFADDLIVRVTTLEAGWAVLGDRDFTLGQVTERPEPGTVMLRLSDGRSLAAPVSAELCSRVAAHEPVMAYFDGDTLTGWYLPDLQRGMDLR